LTIEANGPGVQLGEICAISSRNGGPRILAEAVGVKEKKVLLMPLADTSGIGPGCEVLALGRNLEIPV
ncbi:flagellum-specific ATP synthase, partial [Carboxydocella sp. JDF658]